MSASTTHTNPRAFTLLELMISIALVLLLMIGINQVFKVTGQAIGTNQAISTGVRDARAVQSVMANDFAAWSAQSPAIIIRSERVSAFRNKADEAQDRDWMGGPTEEQSKRTVDIDGDGDENVPATPGELTAPSIYNHRSHRVDVISFFGAGRFRRQTGGALPPLTPPPVYQDEYVADMSAAEAWIWYGHLRRPDERSPVTGSPPSNEMFEHRDPGKNPDSPDFNDRNFYATDFVLGRMGILLVEGQDLLPPLNGIGDTIVDRRGNRQRFIERRLAIDDREPPPTSKTGSLAPLKVGIESNDLPAPTGDGPWELQWSRYDLANTSISQYTKILENYIRAWNDPALPAPPVVEPWFDGMGNWRFQGDPTPLRPLTTSNAARTTPVLLSNCTQFMVEFAGDFLRQDPVTGALDPANPYGSDGTIDFLIDNSVAGAPVRRIRWYGMPRDVAGNATTGGPDGVIIGGGNPAASDPNELIDVVPLFDVLGTGFTYTPPTPPPGSGPNRFIERVWPEQSPGTRQVATDPPHPTRTPPAFYATVAGGGASRPDGAYIAAWGPDTNDQPRPTMIRIVVTIDDPDGRIADGQTFEYVFRVGG